MSSGATGRASGPGRRRAPVGRPEFRVRPTPTGVLVAAALVAFVVVGPQVADPAMAGFLWAAVLGLLSVGLLWPSVAVLVVRFDPAAQTPCDGALLLGATPAGRPVAVGAPVVVDLLVGRATSELAVGWADSTDVVAVAAGTDRVGVPLTPVRRGRFDRLTLRVRSDRPFGMLVASRSLVLEPLRPLLVGPSTVAARDVDPPDVGSVGELPRTGERHGGDTTRSVRPYVMGDPAHLVHWPTTARIGSLVVRELEPPADSVVAVVVDLGPEPSGMVVREATMPTTPLSPLEASGEAVVAEAAAAVAVFEARGVRVVLCTAEPEPVTGEVHGDDATARLALATFGGPGPVPDGMRAMSFRAAAGAQRP